MSGLWHRFLLAQDYAIINPLQVDASLWEDLPTLALEPAALVEQADLMPRLLTFQDISQTQRLELIERAKTHQKHSAPPYFSALIESKSPKEQMQQRLSQRLLVDGPDGKKGLLRYFDPRVFMHLRWLLDNKQMSLLLFDIDCWHWPDSKGNWHDFKSPETVAYSTLRLSESQWQTLTTLGWLNRLLKQLGTDPALDTTEPQLARTALSHLQTAQQLGLKGKDDCCLYAKQSTLFTPRIHQHPDLQTRLNSALSGDISYTSACAKLSDSTLTQYLKELHQPEGMKA